MLIRQLTRTAIFSAAILVVAVTLDYLVNVVVAPSGNYTPWSTIAITLLVAPAFTFFIVCQHAKMERTLLALAEERVARQTAERANAAKSQFLAMMSHELRTPLNAIIGYSEIMRDGADADGRHADVSDHNRVVNAASNLLRLINQVLDFSKMEARRMQAVATEIDIAPIAQEAADAVRPAVAANKNKLAVEIAPDIGAAYSDAFMIRQCLVNLLGNAAKFTKGGVITLRVWREDEDRLVFEVSDTGMGIAPDKIEEVFQPFVQADVTVTRAHEGTGLGLAITRRLARLLGGEISVTSALGNGSTFRLDIAAELRAPENVRPLRRVA